MEERIAELRGFTSNNIKELCGAKHIKVCGKTKDALIEQLLGTEFPSKDSTKSGLTTPEGREEPSSATLHLMEMVMQMQ